MRAWKISSHLNQIKLRTRISNKTKKSKPSRQAIPRNDVEEKDDPSLKRGRTQPDTPTDFNWNKAIMGKIPDFNPEWSEETLSKWLDYHKQIKRIEDT